jgi:hypothetical protein
MRDFAGMGGWHEDITRMHMLKRHRSDKVSGVRDFYFGEGHLNEELLHLDDMTRSFSYRITKCEIPWMNYVSGPRLWPVTADNTSFGVWTGDWVASPQEDVVLIPRTEQNVYQRAFAELERNYFGKKKGPAGLEPDKRWIDGKFPDWQRVTPDKHGNKELFERTYRRSIPMRAVSPAAAVEGLSEGVGQIFGEFTRDLRRAR